MRKTKQIRHTAGRIRGIMTMDNGRLRYLYPKGHLFFSFSFLLLSFFFFLFCPLVWSMFSIVLFLLFPVLFSVLFAEIWMWRPARDYPNDPNITEKQKLLL